MGLFNTVRARSLPPQPQWDPTPAGPGYTATPQPGYTQGPIPTPAGEGYTQAPIAGPPGQKWSPGPSVPMNGTQRMPSHGNAQIADPFAGVGPRSGGGMLGSKGSNPMPGINMPNEHGVVAGSNPRNAVTDNPLPPRPQVDLKDPRNAALAGYSMA